MPGEDPSNTHARRAVLLLGLLVAAPGCRGTYTAVYGTPVVDEDGDGYEDDEDCDDSDDSIHPDAADSEGDGIDQNCDGVDGIADSGL